MATKRLELTEELASYLRSLRQSHPVNGSILTAEILSKELGKNRAWVSQIESRRLKYIRYSDVVTLFQFFFGDDALNSQEYADFSKKFMSNVSLVENEWITEKRSMASSTSYERARDSSPQPIMITDPMSELSKELDQYKKKLLSIYAGSDKPSKAKVLKESVRTLVLNLNYSDELTTLLNCIPLHLLSNAPDEYQSKIKRRLLDILEEIVEHYAPNPSYSCFTNPSFILQIIIACINSVIEATGILYRCISEAGETSDIVAEYNSLIAMINRRCQEYRLSESVLNPIFETKDISIVVTEKHIPELQQLLKKLNLLKLEYKMRSDDTQGQISMDIDPD